MLSNDHNCPLYCAIELFTTAPILPIVAVVTFTRLPFFTSHEPDTMARLRDNREKIAKSSNHVPSKKVDSLRLVVKELQERLNIHHRLLDKIQVKFSIVGHFLLLNISKIKFQGWFGWNAKSCKGVSWEDENCSGNTWWLSSRGQEGDSWQVWVILVLQKTW